MLNKRDSIKKSFEKINDKLFEAIPFEKMNALKGGDATCLYSTDPCDCTDSKDIK